ncbi:hypothetical protein AGR1C_Cc10923 [Agrobacterium fabacearum TT111]|nr:hypothetical protein AGR1C_Cc10923 [Agrobacterium fabacearum TT111]
MEKTVPKQASGNRARLASGFFAPIVCRVFKQVLEISANVRFLTSYAASRLSSFNRSLRRPGSHRAGPRPEGGSADRRQ